MLLGSRVVELIEFLRLGVSTSWFGLACPSHCHPASFASLGFCLLLGFILGCASTALLGFYLFVHPLDFSRAPASPAAARVALRLRGYLHEWGEDWSIGSTCGLANWSSGPIDRGCEEPYYLQNFIIRALPVPGGEFPCSRRRRCLSSFYFGLLPIIHLQLLALEIPPIPDFVARSCANLSGGSLSHIQRANRAWEAGWWARFCLEERLSKPRPTIPFDLPNQQYIVLRAPGYTCPLRVQKASDYRHIVQDFRGPTLSHGFASQAEARAYCQGAGVEYPVNLFQWRNWWKEVWQRRPSMCFLGRSMLR